MNQRGRPTTAFWIFDQMSNLFLIFLLNSRRLIRARFR